MTAPQQWADLIGLTATDASGDKIGTVGQVYAAVYRTTVSHRH